MSIFNNFVLFGSLCLFIRELISLIYRCYILMSCVRSYFRLFLMHAQSKKSVFERFMLLVSCDLSVRNSSI